MPVSYHFEFETGMAIITCSGELRISEAKEAVSALWENPNWGGKSAVWDFRTAKFILTSPEIHDLADYVLSNQPATPPEKVAFVTGRDVDFGLARIFEAFRRDPRTAFQVFRDLDEALRWARVEEIDSP
jgi:hypothetical protein